MSEPTIVITSSNDSIELTGTDVEAGWIYDNDALSSWLALAEVAVDLSKRPNGHGTYFPDQLYTVEHRTTIPGRYFGTDALDAAAARNRLLALFNDGKRVTVTVTDDGGPTSRAGLVVGIEPQWKPDGHFEFILTFAAPDPRRYGFTEETSTGLATPSSGLVWPLGTGVSFWDWGTAGTDARVAFTNNGNTTTYPIFEIGADGSLDAGFAITEVQTGRTLEYPVSTGGNVVVLNCRTQRATANGGDVTGNLTRREWFAVPAGASYEYQFVTLGATTGAPTMRLLAADAYL